MMTVRTEIGARRQRDNERNETESSKRRGSG